MVCKKQVDKHYISCFVIGFSCTICVSSRIYGKTSHSCNVLCRWVKFSQLIFAQSFKFIFYHRLFLGICNSARVTEVMMQLSDDNLPIIGLRFNSIKVDYDAIAKLPALNRTIKFNACAVRVDIYNSLSFELFCFFS